MDSTVEDAGSFDAFAGCVDDPYDIPVSCYSGQTECPPERPWCCLEDLGIPGPLRGLCAISATDQAGVYCNQAATPGCPDRPDACSTDADGDSHVASECGGPDCDDTDADVGPAEPDQVEAGRWIVEGSFPDAHANRDSLVMLPGGDVGLAISVASAGGADVLEWAVLRLGDWQIEEIDSGEHLYDASVSVDGAGAVSIGYLVREGGRTDLRVARRSFGTWTTETLVPQALLTGLALAPGLEGSLHVAYAQDASLWLASDGGGSWTTELVAAAIPEAVDWPWFDIAVDHGGGVHVVHDVQELAHLTDSVEVDGAWQATAVDSFLRSDGVSTAVDEAGVIHAAYYRSVLGDLGYARLDGAHWTTETMARHEPPSGPRPGIVIGFSPSIATGPDGLVAAGAIAGTGATLIWRSGEERWVREQIAHVGYPSLAIGPDGTIHVATSTLEGVVTVQALARSDLRRVDQDCDGVDGVDIDGDGWASEDSGGEDCDDTTHSVFPGAPEAPGDGIDQDCDGQDAR